MQTEELVEGLPRTAKATNLRGMWLLPSGEEVWYADVQFFRDDGSPSTLFRDRIFVEMPGDCVFIAGAENSSGITDLAPNVESANDQRAFLLAMADAARREPAVWRIFAGWEYSRQLSVLRAYCEAKGVSVDVGVGYERAGEYILERIPRS